MSEDEVMNKEDDGDLTNDPYQENEDSDDELEDDQEPDDYVVEEDDDTIDLTHLSKTEVRILLLKDLGKPTASTERNGHKIKKTPIRSLCLFFKKELMKAGAEVAIVINENTIKPWSTNFDNMKLGEHGKDCYWGYISNTIRFCLLCGYYESVLILLPNSEVNTPSSFVEHIISFCNFKLTKTTDWVTTSWKNKKRNFIKDICGKRVKGSGAWKKLGNLGTYASAISATHGNRAQGSQYQERCPACFNSFKEWSQNKNGREVPYGCQHHPHNPRFFISGNPCRKNLKWTNFRKIITQELKNVPIKQATMMNPFELINVIKHCLYVIGGLWGLQTALMILVSCSIYLRNMEMKKIRAEHFCMNLSAINTSGIVNGIMLKLHDGKTDLHVRLCHSTSLNILVIIYQL